MPRSGKQHYHINGSRMHPGFEGMPVMDYRNGASAVEWVKVLHEILKLDFEVVITGHGKLLTKEHVRSDRKNS